MPICPLSSLWRLLTICRECQAPHGIASLGCGWRTMITMEATLVSILIRILNTQNTFKFSVILGKSRFSTSFKPGADTAPWSPRWNPAVHQAQIHKIAAIFPAPLLYSQIQGNSHKTGCDLGGGGGGNGAAHALLIPNIILTGLLIFTYKLDITWSMFKKSATSKQTNSVLFSIKYGILMQNRHLRQTVAVPP